MKHFLISIILVCTCVCHGEVLPKTGGSGSFGMGRLFGYYDCWASEDWVECSVTSSPGSQGDYPRGYAKYVVGDNRSVYPRTATFYYWTTDYGPRGNAKQVEISQCAYDVSVTGGDCIFGVDGGNSIFRVETEEDVYWKAYVDSWDVGDDSNWIEVVTAEGTGSGNVEFIVRPNVLGRYREATIHIASKEYVLTQRGNLEYEGDKGVIGTTVVINASDFGFGDASTFIDNKKFIEVTKDGAQYMWQPLTIGKHTLSVTAGGNTWSMVCNVTNLVFDSIESPNPPMSKDNNISITPTTSEFEVGGGYGAITTSGASETWTAAVSDDWIVLKSTTGTVGKGCAYTVATSTNVETRTGYVYVSGHVHTVKQEGWGSTILSNNAEFECGGGKGTIDVTVGGKYGWNARPNVDWLSVTPTRGVGSGQVTYQVAPWYEVSTRSGTLTVAGNTFTVFQYGKRMKLSTYKESCDYEVHVIPITVDALAITKWSATPNVSWIQVVDSDNGKNRQGGSSLSISIGENPSYKARTGTVTIGSETLTIVQEGRTTLSFEIDPITATADVGGANGLIAVTATPDLPWTSESKSNWLTIYPKFKTGAGNGNVAYTASPNPTLYDRTGTITITPEAASGVASKTHTVTQPKAVSSISLNGYEFEAAGENCAVEVTVDDIVEWQIGGVTDWLTVVGDTTRVGSATITIQAAENTTVYPRSCILTIARKTFRVTQKGRGVTVDTDSFVFGTKSDGNSFTVKPDGNVSWKPVSSDDSWLILLDDEEQTGSGEVQFVVTMYNGTGEARTGTITVGDKVVYVTQRPFDLSINPTGAWVTGNAGAGEIAVSADIDAVWKAIVTESWIKVISGYDSGTGDGVVRYTYEDNDTGKKRSGKIVISGTAYTIEQAARTMVVVNAESGRGGSVSGGGSYSLGTEVTLTAIPSDGYEFAYWDGDVSSMQNPITVTASVAKSVKAIFTPLAPEFVSVSNSSDGVTLVWNNLAWATEYNIYRAPSSSRTGGPLVTLVADGTHSYIDTTGEVGVPYWYWVEAVGAEDTTECVNPVSGKKLTEMPLYDITYENLRGAAHVNPTTYQEGSVVTFTPPTGVVTGYTFAGWSPKGITSDKTGNLSVSANWMANNYFITYHANGGTGEMTSTVATYDQMVKLPENGFTYNGFSFKGWATSVDGDVAYADGASVSNLTSEANGEVSLYAVWKRTPPNWVPVPKDETISVFGDGMGYAIIKKGVTGSKYWAEGSLLAVFDKNGECRWVGSYSYNSLACKGSLFYLYDIYVDSTNEKDLMLKIWNAATGAVYEVTTFDADEDWSMRDEYETGITCDYICLTAKSEANTWSITYENLCGSSHTNPETYTEGSVVTFVPPEGVVAGYAFSGWSPTGIAPETTGDVVVSANWAANEYTITYNANGGSGDMTATVATYDQMVKLSASEFTYSGFSFKGWATSVDGDVVYADGASVSNLTSEANGEVLLYAVWTEVGGGDVPGGGDDPTSYDPPKWVGVTKGDTMVVYAAVQDRRTGERIASAGSLLAAFDKNGECRGVEEVQEGPFGAFFQLTVGIESTSETGFTLKVWNAATGETTDIATTIDANADKQIGEFFELEIYEIGALSQSITLNEGWTWISFALIPNDATIGTLFAEHTFANGDVLKASNKTATYYNGVWYPSNYELASGKAYMVKKSAGGAEVITVDGALIDDGLILDAGWNWLGPTTMETQTVAEVTYTGGFANGDQMRSSSKTATWYGGKWYSSDFKLCPGNGYVAKVTNAGTLYFGEAPTLAAVQVSKMSVSKCAPSLALTTAGVGKPSWKAVTKADNMVVYMTVHDTSTDTDVAAEGSLVAAFDANGECRGVAEIEDGPVGKVFQLTVGIESTAETGFTLKVWDSATELTYDMVEKVDANADKQIGLLWEPLAYTIETVSDPLPEIVNPSPEQIEDVLGKAEDPKLAARITNETDYASLRTWAGAVKSHDGSTAVGAAGVMAAPNAWLSYALGCETLIETAPTDSDLTVETFEPKSERAKFDFMVRVKDVEVGGAATAENLKQIFELEGGTSLDPKAMSSANVDVVFETPVDGKVKFTAGPKDVDSKNFFMKVKLVP